MKQCLKPKIEHRTKIKDKSEFKLILSQEKQLMQKAPKENWKSDPQKENLDPNKSAPSRNILLLPSLEGFAVIRYLAS